MKSVIKPFAENNGTIANDVGAAFINTNAGYFYNGIGASFSSDGLVTNSNNATIDNRGSVTNGTGGMFTNDAGIIYNLSGGIITNHGALALANGGAIYNQADAALINYGTLNNSVNSTIDNEGALTNSTGAILVNNGTFANTGLFTNNGTLTGTGNLIADVTNSGILAPGNYIYAPGAVYQVEVNAAGQSDKLIVTGAATLNGGMVSVLAASGTYASRAPYTILTAGSVSGVFGSVTSNLAFLTPTLSYDPTNVYLTLIRNTTSYTNVAATSN